MLTLGDCNGARLRPLVTLLFREVYVRPHLEFFKSIVQHWIAGLYDDLVRSVVAQLDCGQFIEILAHHMLIRCEEITIAGKVRGYQC